MSKPYAEARKKFEEFARTWNPVLSLAKHPDGKYYEISTEWAWHIWQAAQPTPEQYEQAARKIAGEAKPGMLDTGIGYELRVLQILHEVFDRS